MRAVIVYESMYGNTHHIAGAIGDGLGSDVEVTVVAVDAASHDLVRSADLLIVGGPTHAHGMSRTMTRAAAAEATEKPDNELELEPDAEGPGLREWFAGFDRIDVRAAAFDTRLDAPAPLTGRASKGIARRLRKLGASLIAEPESFLVTKETHLEGAQVELARRWGESLGRAVAMSPASTA